MGSGWRSFAEHALHWQSEIEVSGGHALKLARRRDQIKNMHSETSDEMRYHFWVEWSIGIAYTFGI
jgi:hypothetical protein